jgi:type IV pilus assembly protein PilC
MPRFKFVAMDAKGSETEGTIDAGTQAEAIGQIRAKGLFPTRVAEMTSGGGGGTAAPQKQGGRPPVARVDRKLDKQIKLPKFSFGKKVKTKHLMTFTRQLATLVDAGLPLLRGLRILLKQEKHPGLRLALSGMGESVEGGSTFSEALGMFPRVFDKLYVNMVKAGEAGGVLEVVLTRLADFMEKSERIKRKVKSAMVYPVVVFVAAMGILSFMLVKVIPKFAEIFSDLLEGAALPPLTQFVIDISDLVRQRGLLVAGAIAAIWISVRAAKKTEKGRYVFDRFKLKAPLFGSLFVKTSVARFARTLGTLLSSGVPVLQALTIVRDTAGNAVVEKAIQGVHDSVKEGDTMSMPMEASGVFPSIVVSMVDVGEETGALPEMLMKVADNYDEEVDAAVEGLTSIIEPIMIIFLALIIGTIVIAMFVPLVNIITKMSAS